MGNQNLLHEDEKNTQQQEADFCMNDFAIEYDHFISISSPTEEYENMLRDIARHFFRQGFILGSAQNKA